MKKMESRIKSAQDRRSLRMIHFSFFIFHFSFA